MAQIYKDASGRDVYSYGGQFIDAKTGQVISGALPSQSTVASATATLPQAGSTTPKTGSTSPLLSFAGALDEVVNMARKKRNESSLSMMSPYRGTVAASDFNSILSNLNKASDTTAQDLTKRALEQGETKFDTITDDSGNIYQVEMDYRGKIIGKPELLFGAEGSSGSNAGGYSKQELRRLRAAGIDPSDVEAADNYLYGEGALNAGVKRITPDMLVGIANQFAYAIPTDDFEDIPSLISGLKASKRIDIEGRETELTPLELDVLVSELEALDAKKRKVRIGTKPSVQNIKDTF